MTDVKLIQSDPSPPSKKIGGPEANSDAESFWRRASQVSTVGLFVIAVVWCTYAAHHIIVPLLLAWAIATIVLPLVKGLQNWGVPRVVAAIGVTLVLLCIIMTLLFLLSAPVTYWLGRATYVGALIREKLQSFSQPLALLQELQKGLTIIGSGGEQTTIKVDAQSSSIATTILSVLTPAISEFVLFVGALVFYLIYRQNLRNAVVFFLNNREARLTTVRALNDIDDNMTTYFGTFTLVNLCLGVIAATLTWATGLPNPLLWGVLACVLNYVPYIGPALVIGTLALVGLLVHPTVGEAAVAPLFYLAVVTIEGQFITPTLMGKRLELNAFAVFLAIAFFAWLWGPIGAFLAVPILMAGSVIFGRAFEEEKPDLPT
jgi:predicted PurR-regulated permease PerM